MTAREIIKEVDAEFADKILAGIENMVGNVKTNNDQANQGLTKTQAEVERARLNLKKKEEQEKQQQKRIALLKAAQSAKVSQEAQVGADNTGAGVSTQV